MDQMREILSRILSANGFAEKVEALARMDIANAISEDNELKPVNKYLRNFLVVSDGQAVMELIAGFLSANRLDFTLDVFLAETGTTPFTTDPTVRAMMRQVDALDEDSFNDKIEKMVNFWMSSGDLIDFYPDLLCRLKHRLNIPEYNECVRGAGPDPAIMREAMHNSLIMRQSREENDARRTQSMVCRDRPEVSDDNISVHVSFMNVLNSTADDELYECDAPIDEEQEPEQGGDRSADDYVDFFRPAQGGVLDIMAIAESEPMTSAIHLNEEGMEGLRDVLEIDPDVELVVRELGPNIVVKQLEPRRVEDEPEPHDETDCPLDNDGFAEPDNSFGWDEEIPVEIPWRERLQKERDWIAALPSRQEYQPQGPAQRQQDENRLADIRRQIFEAHCWGTGGDQELAMQRIKSIQQPAFPQGQHDENRLGNIRQRMKDMKGLKLDMRSEDYRLCHVPFDQQQDNRVKTYEYTATSAVVPPSVRQSLEESLNAKVTTDAKSACKRNGSLPGTLKTTYAVPENCDPAAVVESVLNGRVTPDEVVVTVTDENGQTVEANLPESKSKIPAGPGGRRTAGTRKYKKTITVSVPFKIANNGAGGNLITLQTQNRKLSVPKINNNYKNVPSKIKSSGANAEPRSMKRIAPIRNYAPSSLTINDMGGMQNVQSNLKMSGATRASRMTAKETQRYHLANYLKHSENNNVQSTIKTSRANAPPAAMSRNPDNELWKNYDQMYASKSTQALKVPYDRDAPCSSRQDAERRAQSQQPQRSSDYHREKVMLRQLRELRREMEEHEKAKKLHASQARRQKIAFPFGSPGSHASRPRIRNQKAVQISTTKSSVLRAGSIKKRAQSVPIPRKQSVAKRPDPKAVVARMVKPPKEKMQPLTEKRRTGAMSTAVGKPRPDDFITQRRVPTIGVEVLPTVPRKSLDTVQENLRVPHIKPTDVSTERQTYGTSKAIGKRPANLFYSSKQVDHVPAAEIPVVPRASREDVERRLRSIPKVAPVTVSRERSVGGSSTARGRRPKNTFVTVGNSGCEIAAAPPAPPRKPMSQVVQTMRFKQPTFQVKHTSRSKAVFEAAAKRQLKGIPEEEQQCD